MKKLLQLLGCVSLLFMFSCSDDDPKIVPEPDYVYKPFVIKAVSGSDAPTLTYALADHVGLGEVCYTEMTLTYKEGVYDLKPYEYALFCNSESYCTTFTMPLIPYYTLESVDKVVLVDDDSDDSVGVQSVAVVNGECDNANIKVTKGEDNSFAVSVPAIAEGEEAPMYRLVFSCFYGENSPYNNVKAIVYVDRFEE